MSKQEGKLDLKTIRNLYESYKIEFNPAKEEGLAINRLFHLIECLLRYLDELQDMLPPAF